MIPDALIRSSTSLQAWHSVAPLKAQRERMLLAILALRGPMTSDELELFTGLPHQSVSARLSEAAKAGKIVPDCRRRTRSGRMAVAWRIGREEPERRP